MLQVVSSSSNNNHCNNSNSNMEIVHMQTDKHTLKRRIMDGIVIEMEKL